MKKCYVNKSFNIDDKVDQIGQTNNQSSDNILQQNTHHQNNISIESDNKIEKKFNMFDIFYSYRAKLVSMGKKVFKSFNFTENLKTNLLFILFLLEITGQNYDYYICYLISNVFYSIYDYELSVLFFCE